MSVVWESSEVVHDLFGEGEEVDGRAQGDEAEETQIYFQIHDYYNDSWLKMR